MSHPRAPEPNHAVGEVVVLVAYQIPDQLRGDLDLDVRHAEQLWSLTELGDLLAATGYQKIGTGEFNRAFVHDSAELRRSWLDAITDAYDIDKSAVASQARYLQQKSEEASDTATVSDDWFVASTSPLTKRAVTTNPDATLTTEQQRTLLSCLEADSGWIAWAAADVLINVTEPSWDSRKLFEKDMSSWPRWRAGLLYTVAILTAGNECEPLLARAVASDSADYRYGARMTISVASSLDSDGSIMETLRRDADLSVRPKDARKASPAPTHWTCGHCRGVNDIEVEDCPACDEGVRPDT